jgi:hypothetical protein
VDLGASNCATGEKEHFTTYTSIHGQQPEITNGQRLVVRGKGYYQGARAAPRAAPRAASRLSFHVPRRPRLASRPSCIIERTPPGTTTPALTSRSTTISIHLIVQILLESPRQTGVLGQQKHGVLITRIPMACPTRRHARCSGRY